MITNSSPQSLDDLLRTAENYADFTLRYGGRVPEALLLLGPSGPSLYLPKNLSDEQAKDEFAATARHLAIAHDATALVMVFEAWARLAKPGVPLDANLPPSEAPDRQEVVALIGEAVGAQQARMIPILRNAVGTFSGLGESCVQTFDRAQGRFAEILPAQPPTAEEKARSEAILRAQGVVLTPTAPETSSMNPRHRHWHSC